MLRVVDWLVEELWNDVGILEIVVFFTEPTDHVVLLGGITLALSHAWKPERRRSAGCKASAPVPL